MTLAEFINKGKISLERLYPAHEAGNMMLILCRERLGIKEYSHITDPDMEISGKRLESLKQDLERLLNSEPIQYVLGYGWFFGREFRLTPSVLIPRPETEILVDEILKSAAGIGYAPVILDLCTGSGCIAWTLLKEIPGATVTAVDISGDALELAAGQFEGPGPEFIQADILKEVCLDRKFDIIVSNPPYIAESEKREMLPNVLEWEPENALFVPDDDPLVFYRAVARWATALLKEGGRGFVEINERFGEESADVFRSAGFGKVKIINDLSGKNRIIAF